MSREQSGSAMGCVTFLALLAGVVMVLVAIDAARR
jgi:hypothetical protein